MRTGCLIAALAFLAAGHVPAAEIAVSAEPGALANAIAASRPGDVLTLAEGDHAGPVSIDRPLTLKGAGARIVGPGTGTVVRVEADDVTVEGLTVTGSGRRLDELDAGIAIGEGTRRARVIGNQILGNLIGVDVQGGLDALVQGNLIIGRDDLRVPEMGPGVYVWNAPGLVVEGNDISRGRDGVFITTSNEATYRGNTMHELRFALHSMNSNRLTVTGNLSHDNELGFAFMYSHHLDVEGNVSRNDRTHGLFLNFVNRGRIVHNAVQDGGEKCLFVYNANYNEIVGNRLEGCEIGVHFTAGSEHNSFWGNAFIGNRTQVKYVGTRWLEWSREGTGNYWSDHVAFDIDGDGRADSPYRPNDVIDQVLWHQPMAALLIGTPAVQLIRWSQARFPGLVPGGVVDSFPLVSPEGAGPERTEEDRG